MKTRQPLSTLLSLNEKTAVVTSGASPEGIAIASRLAEAGARVLLADTHDRKGYEIVEELENQNLLVEYTHADTTNEQDVKHMLSVCQNAFTSVDILVNIAAKSRPSAAHDASLDDLEQAFHANLQSTLFGIRHAVPFMKEQASGGVIINVTSHPNAHFSVQNLTKSAARELRGRRITVNSVAANATHRPDDVAKTVLSLALPLSQHLTGQQIFLS